MDDDHGSTDNRTTPELSRIARRKRSQDLKHQRKIGRYRVNPTRIVRSVGFLLVLAGVIFLGRIPYFYLHSWWTGNHLTQAALKSQPQATNASLPVNAAIWPSNVLSVLQIPSLGVTAPVLEGTADAEINVGVGHLKTSVMPGQDGTSILAAHNVTWFHNVNQLKTGAVVKVVNRHQILIYHVTKKAIVHVGTPVYNSSGSTILLEACYPLNALYITPYRYLVWASLVSTQTTGKHKPALPPNTQYTPVGIPKAVQAQGLTLATNYMPMGTLTIKGDPSKQWLQSNATLNAADATTELYFAEMHIAQSGNEKWWHELAPRVPYSSLEDLIGAHVDRYVGTTTELEVVREATVVSSAIRTSLSVVGGPAPGVHGITLRTVVSGDRVRVSGVSVR